MYGIIYKAAGPDGRVYIGQTTKTLKERKRNHKARSVYKDRRGAFQIAILEHGFSAFTWDEIDSADNQAELDNKEREWIVHYKSNDPAYGYNLTEGGLVFSPSPETRRKLSEANKGQIPWCKGKKHTEEHRRKNGLAHIGNKSRLGKRHSEETRRKISIALKTPENLKKASEAIRGEKNCNTSITEATARQIKLDLQAGMRICDIARKYGVKKDIVKNIKYGKAWAWLQIGA